MAIFRFFRRHLGFLKFKFFNRRTHQEGGTASPAKFGRNKSNGGRDMTIFRFFQDSGRPPS